MRKDGTKMWPGLVRRDQVDGETCQMFSTGQYLALESASLRERGGVGTRSTWVHHSPANNFPYLMLHQPLCWPILAHQDKV